MLQKIHTDGIRFVDESGRTVILRGVNLGGDCKVPYPNGGTYLPTDFSDHKEISFIGRPFPLAEADEHFSRLRTWGFNCIRFVVTWEAVEHRGPSDFDIAFIDYYTTLCRMAADYGIYVFIDFHQDVWSRMTGGDGAPGWLFEKLGIDYRTFHQADMALVMQHLYNPTDPTPFQSSYPAMCWSQNYKYPINGIMWTLFFGGVDFTPQFKIDGMNVQEYMQSHYIGAQVKIAEKVRNMTNILGFGSLNEPCKGWIEYPFNDRHLDMRPTDPPSPGIAFSPLDSLLLTHGHTLSLPYLDVSIKKLGISPVKQVLLNAKKIPIWIDNSTDPFIAAGIYSINTDGTSRIHNNKIFCEKNSQKIEFDTDFLMPFCHKIISSLHKINPEWLLFVEKDAKMVMFNPKFPQNRPSKMVNATHWYDGSISFLKKIYPFNIDLERKKIIIGYHNIQKMYEYQLGNIKNASIHADCPTLIGECGILFDIQNRKAFRQWVKGNHDPSIWKTQSAVLDRMLNAMDAHHLSWTLWNYTASNCNDPKIGDGWNQEDCSLFSREQQDNPRDLNSGGRALEGVVRPFPYAIQGRPIEIRFAMHTKRFKFVFEFNNQISGPTLLYIPRIQYPNGFQINSQEINWTYDDQTQILTILPENPQNWHNRQIKIELFPKT